MLKAFLVGICASVPLGPVAILVLQKSLSKGRWTGFVTGLGATTVDTMYSVISIFALVFVQKFVKDNEIPILVLGGIIIMVMGIRMAVSNPFRRIREQDNSPVTPADYLQAVLLGISNPGAVFVIIALFAFFGITIEPSSGMSVAPVILSVSAGSSLYWFCFSGVISKLRGELEIHTMVMVNRIAGIVIAIIGTSLWADGLYRLFFTGGKFI